MLYDRQVGVAGEDGLARMTARVRRVVRLLEGAYGIPERRDGGDPLDQLVLTVLSQNTSDRNSWQAYQALRMRFPTWESVLATPAGEVAEAIRCGGLAGMKAGRIQEILCRIRREQGRLDLSFLREMPTEAAVAYLNSFAGVGPKTAACVLLFALHRPVLPVDTHVWRVSRRLALIGETTSAEQAHVALRALVPEEHVYSFHRNMIAHGRRVCRARAPQCGACPLRPECPTGRGVCSE